MSQTFFNGAQAELLMDFETTYDSDPTASSAVLIPFHSITGLANAQQPQEPNVLGGGRQAQLAQFGPKSLSATLAGPVDYTAIGFILKTYFNNPTTTAHDAKYKHVFAPTGCVPSFLMEKQFKDCSVTNRYYKLNGNVANGLSMGFRQADASLQYSLAIIGSGTEAASATSYDAIPADYGRASAWFFNSYSSFTEGGSPDDDITELTFNATNNIDLGLGLNGTGTATGFGVGQSLVSGNIKGMFNSDTLLAKARAHTATELVISLTNGLYIFKVSLGGVQLSPNSPDIAGPAGIYLDLNFTASGTGNISVELENDISSYTSSHFTSTSSTSTTTAP